MFGKPAPHGLLLTLALLAPAGLSPASAQSSTPSDPFTGTEIEEVRISITNPSADTALNDRVTDSVRRRIGIFPIGPRNPRSGATPNLGEMVR